MRSERIVWKSSLQSSKGLPNDGVPVGTVGLQGRRAITNQRQPSVVARFTGRGLRLTVSSSIDILPRARSHPIEVMHLRLSSARKRSGPIRSLILWA